MVYNPCTYEAPARRHPLTGTGMAAPSLCWTRQTGPSWWTTGGVNPYTYEELQAPAAGSDTYLARMSSKTSRLPGSRRETDCCSPTDKGPLQAQGIYLNVLAVITASKGNCLDSQWDQAAYFLFNQRDFGQVVSAPCPDLALSAEVQAVGACLADPQTRRACLELFINQSGLIPEVYWLYQDTGTPYVDACQVFTGPAEIPLLSPAQQTTFQSSSYPTSNCHLSYPTSNCQLSSSLLGQRRPRGLAARGDPPGSVRHRRGGAYASTRWYLGGPAARDIGAGRHARLRQQQRRAGGLLKPGGLYHAPDDGLQLHVPLHQEQLLAQGQPGPAAHARVVPGPQRVVARALHAHHLLPGNRPARPSSARVPPGSR